MPGSGKTTLFNALAHQHAHIGGSAWAEPNLAVVKVPDERLDKLSGLFRPKKHTPAEVRFIDVAGVARGMGHESTAAVLANLRTVDVLLQVVGAFQSERDPKSDVEEFSLELLDVLQRLKPVLEAGKPARSLEFSVDEQKAISSFGFLTQKPTLLVLNLADEQNASELLVQLGNLTRAVPQTALLGLPGKLEMELGELSPEDAAEFMDALNVSGSRLGEVTSMAYSLAELVSFFTAGDDECRAWTIRSGTNAQDAAGAIHSDLARGFIRAEVIRWDQLLEAGSEAAAKKRGWVRQEGKVYVVQDGDVLHVLFNV